MKIRHLFPLLAISSAVVFASAQTVEEHKVETPKGEKKIRRITVTAGGPEATGEKEKVTFLGIETGPMPEVLAEHLGIERDFGLTVLSVAKDSPASGVLQKNDILRKLDDQILVDPRQLSVLIRAKKPGTEVKLTVIRAGKEQTLTAKLGEREVPRMLGMRFPEMNEGPAIRFFNHDGGPALERLRELPGIAREEINDALRIIGNDRKVWVSGPRVHVFERRGKGASTILNMAEGNFAFSDDEGAIEIVAKKGDRQLTVKDAQGKVVFAGPINTDEQREKLPPEVKARLKKLDSVSVDFKADESLEQEGVVVEQPAKTKTMRPLPPSAPRPVAPPARPI